jgi:hypothetical protein
MRSLTLLLGIALAGSLLVGCGKGKPATAQVVYGVTVDMPKLQAAFATASPELQNCVSEVAMGLRYDDFPRSFAGLAKLESAPGVTEPQKKIVSEVAEQIKQVASKASAAPPPR